MIVFESDVSNIQLPYFNINKARKYQNKGRLKDNLAGKHETLTVATIVYIVSTLTSSHCMLRILLAYYVASETESQNTCPSSRPKLPWVHVFLPLLSEAHMVSLVSCHHSHWFTLSHWFNENPESLASPKILYSPGYFNCHLHAFIYSLFRDVCSKASPAT